MHDLCQFIPGNPDYNFYPYFASTLDALTSIEGLQVHYVDEDSSRIIITQEADNISLEMDGLQRIKSLPHVVMAEMVMHICEDGTD